MNEVYIVVKNVPTEYKINKTIPLELKFNEGVFKTEKDANDYITKRLALKDMDDKGCNFTIEPWHVS